MKKTNKKGFTIVELVIVIAVIAILAAVLIPTFGGVVDNAKASAALQEVKNAYTATLADDLTNPETTGDAVSEENEIYVIVGEVTISIINGKAAVYEGTEEQDATHTLENGKLVKIPDTSVTPPPAEEDGNS